jgi:DNA-binding beta-propeller fold protein YncE
MDRRGFLLAAAAAPLAAHGRSFAYVTADTEAHVAIVELGAGRVVHRIPTRPGPRSVERVGAVAVVAHTAVGAVSILDELGVRREVAGFEEPRYTAGSRDGRHAFVTDASRTELLSVELARGEIVGRVKLRLWPRHLSLAPDGRTLWVGLGTATPQFAILDVRDPHRPRLERWVTPPFAGHDVGVAPSGRVWITAGEDSRIAADGRVLPADGAPQHVTFLDGRAYVTSGASGTLRVYDERSARLLHTARIPVGSYNVQFRSDRVLTPSLNAGTLCVLDPAGRFRRTTHVAHSCHDAA